MISVEIQLVRHRFSHGTHPYPKKALSWLTTAESRESSPFSRLKASTRLKLDGRIVGMAVGLDVVLLTALKEVKGSSRIVVHSLPPQKHCLATEFQLKKNGAVIFPFNEQKV